MAEVAHVCPECGRRLGPRDLWAEYLVRECCPCGVVLSQQSQSGWTDAEALLQSDVAAVDAWVASWAEARGWPVERPREREWLGDYRWSVPGAVAGLDVAVTYERRLPNACRLALVSTRDLGAVLRRPGKLLLVCAGEGVEAVAVEGKGACWGAAQLLSTVALAPEAFAPVLGRLRRAVGAALREYGGK